MLSQLGEAKKGAVSLGIELDEALRGYDQHDTGCKWRLHPKAMRLDTGSL